MAADDRPTSRVVVGCVCVVLSLVGGLGSVWSFLLLAFVLGGPAGSDHPSFQTVTTHDLGSVLTLGGVPFASAAGLIFGVYLLASRSYFTFKRRDALVFTVLVAAIPIGAVGLVFWMCSG